MNISHGSLLDFVCCEIKETLIKREDIMYRLLPFLDEVAEVYHYEQTENTFLIVVLAVVVVAAIALIVRTVIKRKKK